MHLTILGQTPAKKNSRKPFVRNGRMMNFPSKLYVQWEKDALKQLAGTPPVTTYPVSITALFFVKDNRGRDIDNMLASIMDMLQKAGIIENDDWKHIAPITIDCGGVDKDNPRCEVYIDD